MEVIVCLRIFWNANMSLVYTFWHIFSTAIPPRKPSSALTASDERPGPSGAEGFTRVGLLPHPSLSDSPCIDDTEKLGSKTEYVQYLAFSRGNKSKSMCHFKTGLLMALYKLFITFSSFLCQMHVTMGAQHRKRLFLSDSALELQLMWPEILLVHRLTAQPEVEYFLHQPDICGAYWRNNISEQH